MAIPMDSVDVNLGKGTAVMAASNLQMLDFHDFGNSLFGGGETPTPATVSVNVR
jgi:hypothetical protein